MRLLGALGALSFAGQLLLSCGVAGAQSLSELQALAKKDGDSLARLDIEAFMKNVVPESKNYAVVVQLTALSPKYKCKPCVELDKTLRTVARGWNRHGDKGQIVFASMDVEDGEELFHKMKIEQIPRLMVFPAGAGPHALANASPREMSLKEETMTPEGMSAKLGSLLGVAIKPDIPVNYGKYLRMTLAVQAAGAGAYLAYKLVNLRMLGRNLWAIATIMFVLLMTSGFMWNKINDPPYMGQAKGGEVALFVPTNNQQFAVETQIVAVTYAVCALCIVILVRHAPKIQSADQRTFITLLFVAVLMLMFSYLNSVFRLKMPGYPFKLLLE
ncbi:oligosaccharyl transferase subunit ost3/OST6 [Coemansia sp. IMI 209128]|nr:oligosaccharyl transferase subunit ost3/OST6 [Coemansia sp. RSA 2530]KAJ2696345.1 oligosaccharyl transferase subunit ost3/OST6 [Coemansia sp. IMI 209128]